MLLIPSGNNVVRLPPRWHTGSGSGAVFVRKMSEAARSLGVKGTMMKSAEAEVIEAVREALTYAAALRKGRVVGHVDDGLGGRTPVVAART